ncbi:MAG: hypothetical protein D6689_02730 [Deltaproteobacteria bacterium]|nr:MAG: hypothetical protein D6689_02730 [Deltaproteobacteria bacterium]
MQVAGETPRLAVRPGDTIGRYRVEAPLGAGGMGEVYAARTVDGGRPVALKLVRTRSPGAIAALKREFRALADVVHPNVVALLELVATGGHWFVAMERIDGVPITEWARPGGRLDATRARAALAQVADGVAALHAAGILHRDVKPSNVLVDGGGRAVLLDFGLAAPVDDAGDAAPALVGTAAYASPEQAAGRTPLSPATDWYGVGAVLYEMLTGAPPFSGPLLAVLRAKQERDPPPPSVVAPGVPADLDALCVALLQRDPGRRPAGEDVIARLSPRRRPRPARRTAPPVPFVGRDRELAALDAALRASRTAPVVVRLRGPSGIGKSALLGEFGRRAAAAGAMVAAGRCYEREATPYKGVDMAIDALSRQLEALPAGDVVPLLPAGMPALVQLFPPLAWALRLEPGGRARTEPTDPHERRRRAFAALRELLAGIAARAPVALVVDDAQWVDTDGADLIAEVLRGRDAPPVLWVLGERTGTAGGAVDAVLRAAAAPPRTVDVGPLDPDAAGRLAARLLADQGATPDAARAAALARDAGGNPYLIAELCCDPDIAGSAQAVALDAILARRIAGLSAAQLQLVRVLAVAARPVPRGVAVRAARALGGATPDPTAALQRARLVRAHGPRDADLVELFHDRIRDAVLADMTRDAVRDAQRQLAAAVERHGPGAADSDALAELYAAAGDRDRALGHARIAALRAAAALAFDRAARNYRLALELADRAGDDVRLQLYVGLGHALAGAGRGRDAADAFLAASKLSGGVDALELRRRAADQLLRAGHMQAGLDTIEPVLRAGGMSLPATPRAALAPLAWGRIRNRARGLRFRERRTDDIAPEALVAVDACHALVTGLASVDPIRAMTFQTEHLRRALAAGEPARVARAIAAEAGHIVARAGRHTPRSRRLLARAAAIADRVAEPRAVAFVAGAHAICAFHAGDWPRSRRLAERTLELLAGCTDVAWETGTAQIHFSFAAANAGQLTDLAARIDGWIADADDRDDVYAGSMLRFPGIYVHLARDEPAHARRDIATALAPWPADVLCIQRWNGVLYSVLVDLYEGDVDAAWRRWQESWPRYRRSLVRHVAQVRGMADTLRASTAVAAARRRGARGRRREWLAIARRHAGALSRHASPWARAMAIAIDGAAAHAAGDADRALRLLAAADRALDAAHMPHVAAGVRRVRGQLVGGDTGRAIVADADRALRALGVRDPAAIACAIAPGFAGGAS